MTLNGLMTPILRYFAKFGSFRGSYLKVVDQPSTDSLPRNVIKYTTEDAAKMVVKAFVSNRLDYCNSLLCGIVGNCRNSSRCRMPLPN